jgi:hypothetical protein
MLRFIWPIFFALIGLLGLVNAILSKKHKVAAVVNVATVFSMATCYVLVPVINEARDSENLGVWKALHAVTVALTFFVFSSATWIYFKMVQISSEAG